MRQVFRLAVALMAGPLGAGTTAEGQSSPRPQPGEGTIAARLAEVASASRPAWEAYVARSRRLAAEDRAVMARELAATGRERMVRAPYASRAFEGGEGKPDTWFASEEARRLADAIITWQTPAGGWAKRVAYDSARAPGQSWYSESDGWSYIGTFDNSSTTSQLWFLARVHSARPDPRYAAAFERGIGYMLAAQYPSGCWPQVYPLQGGYHDAATFNDEVAVNVLRLLDAVGSGTFSFVPPALRDRARAAARGGVECILDAQVVIGGRRTAWGQQHDPITLEPTGARAYELRSLSGRESAGLMTYLMSMREPGPRVVAAIHAVAAHFRATAIRGLRYDQDQVLRADSTAGPLWARMTELGTNRPIFSNRDGVLLYDWNRLTDRRTGYAWYGTEPGSALEKYAKWLRLHPVLVPVEK